MMQLFAQIEQSDISIWVRESLWAFPTLLVAHAVSMGGLAGGGMILALRAIGFAQGVPYRALGWFVPVMAWGGFVASVSGGLLLAGYPAKALTNMMSVDFGRWKFVSRPAATLNSKPGWIKMSVLPRVAMTRP